MAGIRGRWVWVLIALPPLVGSLVYLRAWWGHRGAAGTTSAGLEVAESVTGARGPMPSVSSILGTHDSLPKSQLHSLAPEQRRRRSEEQARALEEKISRDLQREKLRQRIYGEREQDEQRERERTREREEEIDSASPEFER